MKLRFLGTEYECSPNNLIGSEGPVVGKYRGVQWRTKQYNVSPRSQDNVTLHYRGQAYQSH